MSTGCRMSIAADPTSAVPWSTSRTPTSSHRPNNRTGSCDDRRMATQQPERFDAIVIGAGQAGPGIARHLVDDGERSPSSSRTRSAARASIGAAGRRRRCGRRLAWPISPARRVPMACRPATVEVDFAAVVARKDASSTAGSRAPRSRWRTRTVSPSSTARPASPDPATAGTSSSSATACWPHPRSSSTSAPGRRNRRSPASPTCLARQRPHPPPRHAARAPRDRRRQLHRPRVRADVPALRQRGHDPRAGPAHRRARGRRHRRRDHPIPRRRRSDDPHRRSRSSGSRRPAMACACTPTPPGRSTGHTSSSPSGARRTPTCSISAPSGWRPTSAASSPPTARSAPPSTASGRWATSTGGGPSPTRRTRTTRSSSTASPAARRTADGRIPTYAMFTDPPLGRVGMTEGEARQSGRRVLMATFPMSEHTRAILDGETAGLIKLLVDADNDRFLGAATLGHRRRRDRPGGQRPDARRRAVPRARRDAADPPDRCRVLADDPRAPRAAACDNGRLTSPRSVS